MKEGNLNPKGLKNKKVTVFVFWWRVQYLPSQKDT